MPWRVIGREEELGAILAFLADADGGAAALVLSGEPGIGKTVLWEAGVAEARERFGRVLLHRSVEAEAMLSFAGLSDLLVEVFDEVAPSLAPLRRRALEVALLLAEPGDEAPDPRLLGLALLDVVRTLARDGPLVVALDDVQWLDASSAGVLQIALRRLRDEPVLVLATLRKESGVAAPFELERAFSEEHFERRWVGPLSLEALRRLLMDRLSLELTRPELARVQETSGGNPFFALELGREIARMDTRPAPGEALRVPESLQQLLGRRLERLPSETLDVLLGAAALARPTVELVAAAQPDPDLAVDALEAAVRERVVERDGSRLRFAHPLLASVCYERAPVGRRRAVHRALAEVVSDVEERARHLARSTDTADRGIAVVLRGAADHAAERGATAAAAELCELAAELTPPADAEHRRARLLDAARFHRRAGDGERATALLEWLRSEVSPGPERADVLFELVLTLRGEPQVIIDLCDEALAAVPSDDARAAPILATRSGICLFRADVREALSCARLALEKAERAGDPALVATAIARVGYAESYTAQITPGLLERGVDLEQRHHLTLEDYGNSPRYALARLRLRLGEIEQPRAVFAEREALATARGDEGYRAMTLWALAMLEWLAGRWPRALEHAIVAHELAEQTQYPHALLWVGRVKALVEADLGLVDEARASAQESLALARSTENEFFTIQSLGALGHLELALGDLSAAGDYLRDLPGRLLAGGVNDPTVPAWADAIETLVGLGELDRAVGYLERYEAHAEQLASPPAIAGAARCRGVVAAAQGDLPEAFAAFERALGGRGRLPWPLDRGRTLLCLGSAHRQAKHKRAARDALEDALVVFEQLGAPLWAQRARVELRRISGRRRASDALTETEERVARLAAAGRSNKQIAAELYMSVHTVGAHLSRTYRKLGLRSRAELGPWLGAAKPANDSAKAANEGAKV